MFPALSLVTSPLKQAAAFVLDEQVRHTHRQRQEKERRRGREVEMGGACVMCVAQSSRRSRGSQLVVTPSAVKLEIIKKKSIICLTTPFAVLHYII